MLAIPEYCPYDSNNWFDAEDYGRPVNACCCVFGRDRYELNFTMVCGKGRDAKGNTEFRYSIAIAAKPTKPAPPASSGGLESRDLEDNIRIIKESVLNDQH